MLSVVTALILAQTAPTEPSNQPAPMQCETGPLRKSFGQQPWLVYSCSDGATLVVVSDAGNPASPFYFVISPKDGSYAMSGEGNGSKDASASAFEDLKRLTNDDIAAMVEATKAP